MSDKELEGLQSEVEQIQMQRTARQRKLAPRPMAPNMEVLKTVKIIEPVMNALVQADDALSVGSSQTGFSVSYAYTHEFRVSVQPGTTGVEITAVAQNYRQTPKDLRVYSGEIDAAKIQNAVRRHFLKWYQSLP